jgi:acetyl-CoA acetyltransferase
VSFHTQSVLSTGSISKINDLRGPLQSSNMPGEVIAMANPKPLPSHLPSQSLSLAVELKVSKLDRSSAEGLRAFRDAANYIAAGTTGTTLQVQD